MSWSRTHAYARYYITTTMMAGSSIVYQKRCSGDSDKGYKCGSSTSTRSVGGVSGDVNGDDDGDGVSTTQNNEVKQTAKYVCLSHFSISFKHENLLKKPPAAYICVELVLIFAFLPFTILAAAFLYCRTNRLSTRPPARPIDLPARITHTFC